MNTTIDPLYPDPKPKPGTPGRMPGGRNKSKVSIAEIARGLGPQAYKNVKEVLEKGDVKTSVAVLKLIADKMPLPVGLDIQRINSTQDAIDAMAQLITLVNKGVISPTEGEKVMNLISKYLEATSMKDLEDKVNKLLEAQKAASSSDGKEMWTG